MNLAVSGEGPFWVQSLVSVHMYPAEGTLENHKGLLEKSYGDLKVERLVIHRT